MFHIMIVKIPRGEAPEHIRRAWLGLVLPCIGKSTSESAQGVLTGKTVNYGKKFYYVPHTPALSALEQVDPQAAEWWKAHGYPMPDTVFTFCEDEVKVLGQNDTSTAWG
jgi:hypothetical protein